MVVDWVEYECHKWVGMHGVDEGHERVGSCIVDEAWMGEGNALECCNEYWGVLQVRSAAEHIPEADSKPWKGWLEVEPWVEEPLVDHKVGQQREMEWEP